VSVVSFAAALSATLDLPTPEWWKVELTSHQDWLHNEMVYPPTDGHSFKY